MAQYTGKKGNKTIRIEEAYGGIATLPLYNFDMYRKTGDSNWFIIGYTGKETKLEEHLLKPVEARINNEYYEAVQDRSFELMMGRMAKISVLIAKYKRCSVLIDRVAMGFGNSEAQLTARYLFMKQLNDEGFKMPLVASIMDDFEALTIAKQQLEGIKTKIDLLSDQNKAAENKVSMTLEKQLLIISMGLQLGYRINPRETVVLEWIEMNKLLEEKSKLN